MGSGFWGVCGGGVCFIVFCFCFFVWYHYYLHVM